MVSEEVRVSIGPILGFFSLLYYVDNKSKIKRVTKGEPKKCIFSLLYEVHVARHTYLYWYGEFRLIYHLSIEKVYMIHFNFYIHISNHKWC